MAAKMSLLIGDIGGTSSRWAVVSESRRALLPLAIAGFNPVTGEPGALQAALRGREMAEAIGGPVRAVVAYGAGCGTRARCEVVQAALAQVWPQATIDVESDLLGAARGLYGRGQGLVLILGTGMNAGHFDGAYLHTPMPSLGYILGDEGSGADLGKHLLRDALYGLVPPALRTRLFPQGPDLPAVLQATYRSAAPQAYVASFTAALSEHLDDTYVHDLIASRFFALARLLPKFFAPQELRQVRATGSVAHAFRTILGEVLAQQGMELTAVASDPLPGLLEFHAGGAR